MSASVTGPLIPRARASEMGEPTPVKTAQPPAMASEAAVISGWKRATDFEVSTQAKASMASRRRARERSAKSIFVTRVGACARKSDKTLTRRARRNGKHGESGETKDTR